MRTSGLGGRQLTNPLPRPSRRVFGHQASRSVSMGRNDVVNGVTIEDAREDGWEAELKACGGTVILNNGGKA